MAAEADGSSPPDSATTSTKTRHTTTPPATMGELAMSRLNWGMRRCSRQILRSASIRLARSPTSLSQMGLPVSASTQ